MELRHLRYFVAVAEELHFHRAAARLRVAQPSLGRQLRDLENELGVLLLERNRHGTRLTDAGRAFLPAARATLAKAEEAVNVARRAAQSIGVELRVGQLGVLTAPFLPAALVDCRRELPSLAVSLAEMEPDAQFAALGTGRIDLGLLPRLSTDGKVDRRFHTRRMFAGPMVLTMAINHPALQTRRRPSSNGFKLADFARETFLRFQPAGSTAYLKQIIRQCEAAGFQPRLSATCVESVDALLAPVAAGQGMLLLPGLVAERLLAAAGGADELVTMCQLRPPPRFELVALWSEPGCGAAVIESFLHALDAAIAYALPPVPTTSLRPCSWATCSPLYSQ